MSRKKPSTGVYEGRVADLHFDDKNFNKHTKQGMQMLDQSISRNGFGRSVLVDKDDRLIAGNGVSEQALKRGDVKTIVVETTGDELVVVKRTDMSLDSKEGREMALADNVTSAIDLNWDEDIMRKVQAEIEDLEFEDWGLELPPLEDEAPEAPAVSSASVSEDGTNDEGQVEAVNFEEIPNLAFRGDVWQLGNHRLVCGDPSSERTMKSLMQGVAGADMLYVDSVLLGKLQPQLMQDVFLRAYEVLGAGCPVYVWYDTEEADTAYCAFGPDGFKFSELLVWVKDKSQDSRLDFKPQHELCIYGWKPGSGHKWYGGSSKTSVLQYDATKSVDGSVDYKPLKLIAHLMECSTQTNGIVLDPFGQRGSTLIAAEQMHRSAYLCEVNALKCNAIIDRYVKLVGSTDNVYRINPDGTKTPYEEVIAEVAK